MRSPVETAVEELSATLLQEEAETGCLWGYCKGHPGQSAPSPDCQRERGQPPSRGWLSDWPVWSSFMCAGAGHTPLPAGKHLRSNCVRSVNNQVRFSSSRISLKMNQGFRKSTGCYAFLIHQKCMTASSISVLIRITTITRAPLSLWKGVCSSQWCLLSRRLWCFRIHFMMDKAAMF